TAIANPIGQVLTFLGATMVGGGGGGGGGGPNRSDFNGDGQADILWQNSATGERSIWIMSGTTYAGSVSLPTVSTAWSIAGSSDFNGDGQADILWQNSATGERSIWIMSGTTYAGSVSLPTVWTAWSIRNY
ncbi:MAG: hypothetical protein DME66_11585, partial [Verrucomicrobia bacterium]